MTISFSTTLTSFIIVLTFVLTHILAFFIYLRLCLYVTPSVSLSSQALYIHYYFIYLYFNNMMQVCPSYL